MILVAAFMKFELLLIILTNLCNKAFDLMYRGWIRYVLASISVFLAVCMLWSRLFNRGKPLEPFRIILPPNKNAVEQLLTLQEAISKFEALIQDGNIILLKIRALLFAALPPVCVQRHAQFLEAKLETKIYCIRKYCYFTRSMSISLHILPKAL